MDLSKNTNNQSQNTPPESPQEGFTAPGTYPAGQVPHYDTQGHQNATQGPYNQPTEQFPQHPPVNPYGYPSQQPYPTEQYPQQGVTPYGYQQQSPYNQQPGYPPNPYGQPQYYGHPGQPYGYPPVETEAEKIAKQSWILGLVGLFVFGIILGTIGLIKAFKAQSLGANATAGFILSSLSIVGHIFWMVVLFATGDSPSNW